MKKDTIAVIMQALYGNRTYIELNENDIDYIIQGCVEKSFGLSFEPDRTIVRIPDSQCIIVYNKYQEEDTLMQNAKWEKEDGFIARPVAVVPEQGVKIYSRCFMCRMMDDGTLASIQKEDMDLISRYLSC